MEFQNARNFVTSSKPPNEALDTRSTDIPCYSAGHTKHEWTSWACIDALFPFLEEKYDGFLKLKSKGIDKKEDVEDDQKDVEKKEDLKDDKEEEKKDVSKNHEDL